MSGFETAFSIDVRQSRIFYRRRLAERLALEHIRVSGGFDPEYVAKKADVMVEALKALEDKEVS